MGIKEIKTKVFDILKKFIGDINIKADDIEKKRINLAISQYLIDVIRGLSEVELLITNSIQKELNEKR